MSERGSRRGFLAALGSGTVAAVAGCSSDGETSEGSPTGEGVEADGDASTAVPAVDPVEHDKLIGAYYYSWYRPPFPFREYTPAEPILGYYRSADTEVINQHIVWARNHGINWFNMSWDGRNTSDRHAPQDEDITDGFLEAELMDRIKFSIFYESNIFLEEADDKLDFNLETNRETLRRDFQYLEETFFDESNYLSIDGRPVLTFYTADSFGGSVGDAFADATDAIDHDPYLVADILGSTDNRTNDWITAFDAVTGYSIYNEYVVGDGDYSDFVEYADREMREWALVADYVDLDVIPNVLPGYDDTEIQERPEDNPVLEREPDGFSELAATVYDWIDPDLDAIMITSFNEWPEYTAVEPAESYGTTYLEIVEEEMARAGEPSHPSTDGYPIVRLDFDRTVQAPEEPIEFTIMFAGLTLEDAAGERLAQYDIGIPGEEPYILDGAFDPTRRDDHAFETWRWLGGPTGRTLLALERDHRHATTAGIHATAPPFAEKPVEADVYVDGQRSDHVVFEPDLPHTYQVSLIE